MRMHIHLVASLVLLGAATTRAQVYSPDNLIGKPPAPPATRHRIAPSDNLQWLWHYAQPSPQGMKSALLADNRFPALLKDQLKAPQAFWGIGVPLGEAAGTFLAGTGTIASPDNRHLTITGCVVDQCSQRGLLWLDLGRIAPLLVFAALRWNEQGHAAGEAGATFTLWLFPNRELDPRQLPDALKTSLQTWSATSSCPGSTISDVIVVDPTGTTNIIGKLDAGLTPAFCNTPKLAPPTPAKDPQ